uniref:Calcyphosin n=2 Tax=Suricata suricatta TaxID=37032 RepID=A0A673T8J3_SURSU
MDAVDATVEKLRAQCLSRGASGIQGLARFFRRLDRDKSRSLDSGELRRGLAELGLGLDAAEAEGVCRRWDRDGSGTLDLEEFLRALRPPMSQAREAVIAAAFAKLDRSGDGVVTVDDLRGVYSGRAHPKVRSGEWTEEQVLRRFLDNFDSSEKDGQVTLAEFQDYYSGVSASVDTDEEFVAMMTSAWQLEARRQGTKQSSAWRQPVLEGSQVWSPARLWSRAGARLPWEPEAVLGQAVWLPEAPGACRRPGF